MIQAVRTAICAAVRGAPPCGMGLQLPVPLTLWIKVLLAALPGMTMVPVQPVSATLTRDE